MDSFCKLSPNAGESKFVLKGINPSQLDRQYLLHDLQSIGIEQLSQALTNKEEDPLFKLTTSLEHLGMVKNKNKAHDTILLNECEIKLFFAPWQAHQCDVRKLSCWYCRHTLPSEWFPLGIPVKYDITSKTFDCEGVFCSFNCIVAYLNEHSEYRYKDSTVLLCMMHRHMFNVIKKLTDILPSPSWKLLKEYGGHLTIDEYRKQLQCVEYRSLHQVTKKDRPRVNNVAETFMEV